MEPRCYTVAAICAKLSMSVRTFRRLRADGQLPFLEEIRPRAGRVLRFRADLVDRYLSNQWTQPRLLAAARRAGR